MNTYWERAKSEDRFIRQALAEDESCPSEVLEYLCFQFDSNGQNKEHRKVLQAVALNKQSPIRCLVYLSSHDFDSIRRNVASNPFCPLDILDSLERDEKSIVRVEAENNKACHRVFLIKEYKRLEKEILDLHARMTNEIRYLEEKQLVAKRRIGL